MTYIIVELSKSKGDKQYADNGNHLLQYTL